MSVRRRAIRDRRERDMRSADFMRAFNEALVKARVGYIKAVREGYGGLQDASFRKALDDYEGI